MEYLKATLQKSYYKKAYIENNTLYSYDTPILRYENGKITKLWNGYSHTTMNHIRDFIKQYTNITTPINKSWWVNLPSNKQQYKIIYRHPFVNTYRPNLIFDDYDTAQNYCDNKNEHQTLGFYEVAEC